MSPAEYMVLYTRIERTYEISKVEFTKDMTTPSAKKIGPRNGKVEHLVPTSSAVSTKDALSFVWHRQREADKK